MKGLCRLSFVRRLMREEKGTAAVEYAFVLLPFISLLFMIIETAIVFLAGQTLETAVSDSSRLIMTGQAQSKNWAQSDFVNAICTTAVKALFNCSSLYVDVKTYTAFANVDNSIQLDGTGKPITTYNPGIANNIVVVRIIYQWPIVAPLIRTYLADPSAATRTLVATAAFRNEPY